MNKFHKKAVFGAVLVGALALVGGAAVVRGQGLKGSGGGEVQARLAELGHVKNKKVCDTNEAGGARCAARVVVDDAGNAKANAALPSGYGPQQFLAAYNLPGSASLTPGPVVAIVDAYDDPNIAGDLKTYSTKFGIPVLPACSGSIQSSAVSCFQKMNQNGGTNSFPRSNSGWALEISLDVETIHAACQNCRILLVEANSSGYADLLRAVDTAVAHGAAVVSNSWGSNEFSGEASYDSHFNHRGVAFTFSAGDGGYGVEYPAASQYVTAVGGTTLLVNPDNSYLSESAWNGTGSGCSAYEGKPSWQTDLAGCAKRTVADVSADADPATGAAVYDSVRYDGQAGWFQVGGTSLASPLIAATYALGGVPAAISANAVPYLSTGTLHDVLTGSNGNCGSYLCHAGAGYDGPTGLGTPNGTSAF